VTAYREQADCSIVTNDGRYPHVTRMVETMLATARCVAKLPDKR
jgi:hypothetical protein